MSQDQLPDSPPRLPSVYLGSNCKYASFTCNKENQFVDNEHKINKTQHFGRSYRVSESKLDRLKHKENNGDNEGLEYSKSASKVLMNPQEGTHNTRHEEYEKFVEENQSSEESFDGIRWHKSPQELRVRQTAFSSSPLKGYCNKSSHRDNKYNSSMLVDEQANSVLSKYGSNFQNIFSRSPIMERAHSDLHIEERDSRKHALQEADNRSSVQKRSRSVGITNREGKNLTRKPQPSNCLNSSKGALSTSALNSWIDKFEVEGCTKNPNLVGQVLSSQPIVEKSNNATVEYSALTKESRLESLLEDVDFSDDFSDNALFSESNTKDKIISDAEDPFLSDEDLNLNCITGAIQSTYRTGLQYNEFDSKVKSNLASRNIGCQKWTSSMAEFENRAIESNSPENTQTNFSYSKKYLNRFKIKSILKKRYRKENRDRGQLVFTVQNNRGEETKLIVRGEYLQLDFKEGDIVHVIVTNPDNQQLIDDRNNLLIWNPDVLVSATTISQQLSCARKSVLLNRFWFPNETSKPLLVGVILHEVFQSCFLQCNWNIDYMKILLDANIEERKLEIFSIGDIISEIKSEVAEQLPYLERWFLRYYKRTDNVSGSLAKSHPVQLKVNKALEVEDNVWSPTFGIKGKIDVVFDGEISNGTRLDTDILPLELKTGKEHVSHLAQSSLYSLLLKDKYDVDVFMFLLVYTKEKISRAYDISSTDLKSLINLRNRITKYLVEGSRELPQTINQTQCDTCLVRNECVTIHKITNDQRSDALPVNIYRSLTSHLDGQPHYGSFYDYWDTLITKEESISMSLKKYLWIYSSKEREELDGRSVGALVVKESSDSTGGYIYTLERSNDLYFRSLQDSALSKHDKIILSDENGHFALAQGFIMNIRPSFMIVLLDKKIDSKFRIARLNESQKEGSRTTFRVDKDDMFHGMGLARFNILNLFMLNGDSLRRELVVDLRKPRFLDESKTKLLGQHLNNSQKSAIQKILKAEDYCLVLGMPGTGKTTVIAELIRNLVKLGNSVLITSYTHSALDNILLKLVPYQIDILRIGSPSRVHKDIQKFIPGRVNGKKIVTYEDYYSAYLKPMVVATTCLGVNDVAFNLRSHFDYCIMDEASQTTLPVSLGPLRFSDKFVLVGDHYQLPPLVQHPDSYVKDGMSQSLFKILGDTHPSSVVELDLQYRMCEEIMILSNSLIYNGRLKCGSEKVAKQSLHIPHPNAIQQYVKVSQNSKEDLWMDTVFYPKNKVIFLNHDLLPGRERFVGQKIENITECNLIHKIANGLVISGVHENQIGIMSLYRSQIRLLQRKLQHLPGIDILTADQFQGRDKDCVLISLVRSNEEKKVGDLLKEWRRINVAMTRSKTKLIILGSESTIREEKLLNSFTSLIQEKGWIYNLKPNCMDVYEFNDPPHNAKKRNAERENRNDEIVKKNPLLRDILNGSQ